MKPFDFKYGRKQETDNEKEENTMLIGESEDEDLLLSTRSRDRTRNEGEFNWLNGSVSASEPGGREFYPGLCSCSVFAIICNEFDTANLLQVRFMVTSELSLTCCKLALLSRQICRKLALLS
ncbi:hypothetical protein AVEN_218777-1 [Araneus ventricosus]|uniref:Uncharacterized protein n=1 Tax=Araneus ventricosus TaxID=182803 RepID=A0A4Y2B6X1_ARAVE|nr:hypothetical protein AVEN_218777-1 [Araneus ventricosus]